MQMDLGQSGFSPPSLLLPAQIASRPDPKVTMSFDEILINGHKGYVDEAGNPIEVSRTLSILCSLAS